MPLAAAFADRVKFNSSYSRDIENLQKNFSHPTDLLFRIASQDMGRR